MNQLILKWTPILGIESFNRLKDCDNNIVWLINCNQTKLRKLGIMKNEALSLFYADFKEKSQDDIRIVSAANAMCF